jgi:phage terminase small subunit
LSERYAGIRTEEFLLHAAVAVAENAAVQHAKLGGLLGLSPVAERGLSFTPTDRSHAF